MEKIDMKLDSEEFEYLNRKFPRSEKSADIGKRAEEIIRYYFKHKYPNCKFLKPPDGSDLEIEWESGKMVIEIKGTSDNHLSWQKLKVSSQKSYEMLRKGLPVYRVTNVFDREPVIYVLKYSHDFNLVEEKRWAFKLIR